VLIIVLFLSQFNPATAFLKSVLQYNTTKRRSRKNKQKGIQEMAPIRQEKETELNIPQHCVSNIETAVSSTNYHAIKF
jgi:hypothetical protein